MTLEEGKVSTMEVLDTIPSKLDINSILKKMHTAQANNPYIETMQELVDIVHPVAKPKVIYEVAYVEDKIDDSVTIAGIVPSSRVLRKNLDKVTRL